MKRAIATLFLFTFLTVHTGFGQLLRLPVLIHHYLEHVEWDNSSFFEFISEHYATTINHPDDKHHDHQRLPFKSMDCQAIQVIALVPQPAVISQAVPETIEPEKTIRHQQHYSNTYLNSIWQPPRFS